MFEAIGWYANSLASFWAGIFGFVGRDMIKILLLVLLFCWLRKKGCFRCFEDSCCRAWKTACGAMSPDCCRHDSRTGDAEPAEVREEVKEEG